MMGYDFKDNDKIEIFKSETSSLIKFSDSNKEKGIKEIELLISQIQKSEKNYNSKFDENTNFEFCLEKDGIICYCRDDQLIEIPKIIEVLVTRSKRFLYIWYYT
jgi:hypothetical protein